jgi:hypothetical protein
MIAFETISIVINLFLVFILLMKGNYIKFTFRQKTLKIILWIFLVLFTLNTIGNIFAKTSFEKFFAILTLVFALLIWKILRENKNENKTSVSRDAG